MSFHQCLTKEAGFNYPDTCIFLCINVSIIGMIHIQMAYEEKMII